MATSQERYIAMLEGREIPPYTPPQQNDGIPAIHKAPQAYIPTSSLLSQFMAENGLSIADVMAALSEVE